MNDAGDHPPVVDPRDAARIRRIIVFDGRQPPALSLRRINATPLSADWSSHLRTLGFEPAH
jgi:hypothetical protein